MHTRKIHNTGDEQHGDVIADESMTSISSTSRFGVTSELTAEAIAELTSPKQMPCLSTSRHIDVTPKTSRTAFASKISLRRQRSLCFENTRRSNWRTFSIPWRGSPTISSFGNIRSMEWRSCEAPIYFESTVWQYGIPTSRLRQWLKDGPKEFFLSQSSKWTRPRSVKKYLH